MNALLSKFPQVCSVSMAIYFRHQVIVKISYSFKKEKDTWIGERVVQRRYIQCIWSGYRIPKQAHLSVFLESEPHSLAQKQTSFWSNQERDEEISEDFAWTIFWALGNQYFNHSFKFWENDWNQLLHHFWWSMAIMHYFCLCLMFNLWEA